MNWDNLDEVKAEFGRNLSEICAERDLDLFTEANIIAVLDALDATWCAAVISAYQEWSGSGIAPTAPVPAGGTSPAPVPAPVENGTKPAIPDLYQRGITWYRESLASGTALTERELAAKLGQKGRRLARKCMAAVEDEMVTGGAESV